MKKIFCLFAGLLIAAISFSQQRIRDGIYPVDQLISSKHASETPNRALVQFNPAFINEDPENYTPLVIKTDDYFSFESCGQIFIQNQKNEYTSLLLQLTEDAKEKLAAFTSGNLMKNIAVVVNNEALAVYTITKPVRSGLIKISKCNARVYNQVLKDLKRPCKI